MPRGDWPFFQRATKWREKSPSKVNLFWMFQLCKCQPKAFCLLYFFQLSKKKLSAPIPCIRITDVHCNRSNGGINIKIRLEECYDMQTYILQVIWINQGEREEGEGGGSAGYGTAI